MFLVCIFPRLAFVFDPGCFTLAPCLAICVSMCCWQAKSSYFSFVLVFVGVVWARYSTGLRSGVQQLIEFREWFWVTNFNLLSLNHLLTSISLLCDPVVSYLGLYHEGRLSLFFSREKHLSSWWYTSSFPQLLHFSFSPRFLFPLFLGRLLRGLLSSSTFVILTMNLFCCANLFFVGLPGVGEVFLASLSTTPRVLLR